MMEKINDNFISQTETEKEIERLEKLVEEKKIEKINLAKELVGNKEGFPFSGIKLESYRNMKSLERDYPGFTTPVDEQIERFKKEKMKVVFGLDPESGNVFILPKGSEDINNDSIAPRILQAEGMADGEFRKFVLLEQEFELLCQKISSLKKTR